MDLRLKVKDDSIDTLNRLKRETGLDDGELLSHALSLYNACLKEVAKGKRICIVDDDGDVIKELVLNTNKE